MIEIQSDKLEQEKEQLMKVDSLLLIEYIRSSVEVLVSLKHEDDDQLNNNIKSLGSL